MTVTADILFLNGKIHTGVVDAVPPQALAVWQDRILAIGQDSELRSLPARQTIDLQGKTLLPGLIDAHNHLSLYSLMLDQVDCRVSAGGDLMEVLERIRLRAAQTPPGEWLRGWGFADYKVQQRRYPSLDELEEAAPDHALVLLHASGHTVVINRRAMGLLGIDERTPDPPGGSLERNPSTGQLTGVLHETAMQRFSLEAMFKDFNKLQPEQQLSIIASGAQAYARLGITTNCDPFCTPQLLAAYQAADAQGLLPIRVVAMPFFEWSKPVIESGLRQGLGQGHFKLGAIKLLGDGSLSGRTAAVSQPYANTQDTGILYRDQETLNRIVEDLDQRGLQVAIHAIGDRAIAQVLAAYERVIGKGQPNLRRHRMEHAGILTPRLLQRMAEVDLVIATQPRMLYEQGDGFYRSCGAERIELVYPYRSFLEYGLHVGGSSDCPVVSPDPVLGMRDAILRQTEEGRILAPGQCLEPRQALDLFTKGAAYTLFEENEKGTLEEGKLADMVMLSADPLSVPAEQWETAVQVEMTVVGGKIVYTKD